MRWTIKLIEIDNTDVAEALQYCKTYLAGFDTSKLDWVRIDNGRSDYATFYGRCWYPVRGTKKKYRVSCQINSSIIAFINENGVFKREQRRSPLYFKKNGVEIDGCREEHERLKSNPDIVLGEHVLRTVNGLVDTAWVKIREKVPYYTFAECIIAIFGHEIGHFLSMTKQIPFKNTEIEIDKFEDQFLENYRKWKNEKQETV